MKKIQRLILSFFLFCVLSKNASATYTAIYGSDGEDFYQFTGCSSVADMKGDCWNGLLMWALTVQPNGDLTINSDSVTLVHNGVYMGSSSWGSNVTALKTPPTSITRYELVLGGAGDTSFATIESIINSQGVDGILLENFTALKNACPGLDAINDDDESNYDINSTTTFGQMLNSLGMKLSQAPYTNQGFWVQLKNNLGSGCDMVYLQCYQGGAGNDPGQWDSAYGNGFHVYPGIESNNHSSATFASWASADGVTGGVYWPDVVWCPGANWGAFEIMEAMGCNGSAITPYLDANGTGWQAVNSATVTTGSSVDLGPQSSGGTWSWTGPNGYTSTSREIDNIPLSAGTNTFTATNTLCGVCQSTETFTITVAAPTATPTPTPACGTLVADFESDTTTDNLGGYISMSYGGTGCTTTANPNPWLPTSGDGLGGTTYGANWNGTIGTTGCYGPSLLLTLGSGTPSYSASGAGQNAEIFHIKILTGPASGPATVFVGAIPTNGTSSGFQYPLVIPSSSFNTDLTETVYLGQMAYNYGPVSVLNTTELYQLYFEPDWTGSYNLTVDQVSFTCAATPTPTPTKTFTSTATYTPTFTWTYTPTKTYTNTSTSTNTSTRTPTHTPTFTNTATLTSSPSPTASPSATPTKSNTPTASFTFTGTNTYTFTPTATATHTNTRVNTPSNTATSIYTNTVTPTLTAIPTSTNSATSIYTSTSTSTPVNTPTSTPTDSFTFTRTYTSTPTTSFSPTFTPSHIPTFTPTYSSTFTPSHIFTFTQTSSPTATHTATWTSTSTDTPTSSFTQTFTPSHTLTAVPSSTPTFTPTFTPSFTPGFTSTTSFTQTSTPSHFFTFTQTSTPTFTQTPSRTPEHGRRPVVYPNPVSGAGPAQLSTATTAVSDVEVDVFTTAFRKVNQLDYMNVQPGASVPVPLTDKWGSPLADGLYYLIVHAQGSTSTVKMLLLR